MKESDLFAPVKELLISKIGCEKVFGEVLNYDVVAVVGQQIVIVEMKKILNFKVIEQAVAAKRHGNYVFIAVPKKKGGFAKIVTDFLKYHGIGLILIDVHITYHYSASISHGMFAKYNRQTADIRKYIKEGYHDRIGAGHRMGDFDYESDYTLMINDVKQFLRRRSEHWFSVEEILNYCQCYYANPKPQLAATLRAHYNSSWVEQKKIGRKTYFKWRET